LFANVASVRKKRRDGYEPCAVWARCGTHRRCAPFLVGIALRTARTALRKKRVRRWLLLSNDGALPEVASTHADTRTREAVRRVYAVLDELDDRERLAFVLRHAEGHELTETA
jgi:RNA polymerase sigma-70 factor (ECF subfamily)